MKKHQLEKLSTEQLQKRHSQLKTITILLAVVLIALFGITGYNSLVRGALDPLMITAFALTAIIPLNVKQLKEMKSVLSERENQN